MARREDVSVRSCPHCLMADEATSMVAVALPHAFAAMPVNILLCRQCARSIADAWDKLAFEESRAEVHSAAHLSRAVTSGDRSADPAEADRALVPQGQPSGASSGIDSGESGTDASGEAVSVEPQSAASEGDFERSENSGK